MIKKNRHAVYDLDFHLVVVTKYRNKVINGELNDRLIDITKNIFENKWKLEIIEINTDLDHIHILFSASPQTQLSKLINNFKTVTSRLIRKEFPDFLKKFYWEDKFWSESYFICTVSERSKDQVSAYIQNQGV